MPIQLQRIIDSLANQALEAFDLATGVDHPGEGGRAREEVIRRFLTNVLPLDFGIDTGFVIDATGQVSKQIDIVIYWKGRFPVLDIGGVKHFMIESVAAAIETKATIGSAKVLQQALDNIASVKMLDRSNGGRNRTRPGQLSIDRTVFQHQVWTAVVAGTSMATDTVVERIYDWLEGHKRILWPNAYLDVREVLVQYLVMDNGFPANSTTDPMAAGAIYPAKGIQRQWGMSPPLAFFAVDLLDFLRVTPMIDYSPTGYFYRTMVPASQTHLLLPDSMG